MLAFSKSRKKEIRGEGTLEFLNELGSLFPLLNASKDQCSSGTYIFSDADVLQACWLKNEDLEGST